MNERKIYMNVYLEGSYFNEHSDHVCHLAESILERATDYATDRNASKGDFIDCFYDSADDELIYYDDLWSSIVIEEKEEN